MTSFKTYGERNSGTRYLEQLLRRNVEVRLFRGTIPETLPLECIEDTYFRLTERHNLGWKHAIPPADLERPGVGFITVVKNPYAWLLSMHRRPHHNPAARRLAFEEFLEAPWPTVGRENHPRPFANPMELWNVKYRAYLALGERVPHLLVRYEDLVAEPEDLLRRLAGRFSLDLKPGFFRNIERSTKGDQERGYDFCRRHYLEEAWREALTPHHVSRINRRLDQELVEALGYALLPAEAVS